MTTNSKSPKFGNKTNATNITITLKKYISRSDLKNGSFANSDLTFDFVDDGSSFEEQLNAICNVFCLMIEEKRREEDE